MPQLCELCAGRYVSLITKIHEIGDCFDKCLWIVTCHYQNLMVQVYSTSIVASV